MTTLLRRETWEHRAIVVAPAVFGALFILISILAAAGAIHVQIGDGGVDLRAMLSSMDGRQLAAAMQMQLGSLALLFDAVMLLVITFYLLDCLYAERKDRSILFWKSLPVSDLTVVGSKLLTATVVIPVVTGLVFLATAVGIYLIIGSLALFAGSGAVLAAGPGAILETLIAVVYGMIAQSLWYLPMYGWLLLVSAWAKRTLLLWAVLPLFAVTVLERMVFGTGLFGELLRDRITGVFPVAFRPGTEEVAWEFHEGGANVSLELTESLSRLLDPAALLLSPGLWGGLIVAVLLCGAAVWLRRYRDET
jgi:ABC-2 type transport system permease protein